MPRQRELARLEHRAGRVIDQMHVVETGREPHAYPFARAGVGAHPRAHVDAFDAEEHQGLHAERLGHFEHGIDITQVLVAVRLGLGQVLRAQSEGQALAPDMRLVARGVPGRLRRTRSPPSASSSRQGMKFIAGEPMKPATKRVLGA